MHIVRGVEVDRIDRPTGHKAREVYGSGALDIERLQLFGGEGDELSPLELVTFEDLVTLDLRPGRRIVRSK